LTTEQDSALPALPLAYVQNTAQIFSGALSRINAVFWRSSIEEILPALMARLGLTPERPRIFISYRRREAQVLADQLFSALAERNFDVFLDCFRVPPGIDFQRRLRQELGDKSVVLVLETTGILESEWTLYEIETARANHLGLIGLQLPGGKSIPSIDESRRIRLLPQELTGTGAPAELTTTRLPALLTDIIGEHDRAVRRRLEYLRGSVSRALSADGWSVAPLGGALLMAEDPERREWRILVCVRSPELVDFHTIREHLKAWDGKRAAVVGLIGLLEPTACQPLLWLADLSKYSLCDTANVKTLGAKLRTL
jgi:hypothetical protein